MVISLWPHFFGPPIDIWHHGTVVHRVLIYLDLRVRRSRLHEENVLLSAERETVKFGKPDPAQRHADLKINCKISIAPAKSGRCDLE